MAAGDRTTQIKGFSPPSSITFQRDGKHVVCACRSGTIERWRVETGESVSATMSAGSSVCALSTSKNGRWVVCGTAKGLAIVWNAETDQGVVKIKPHDSKEKVSTVDVSPDSRTFATDSGHGASVWEIETGQKLLDLPTHTNRSDSDEKVRSVKFSPDGGRIAVVSNLAIRVFHSQSGSLLLEIPDSAHPTSSPSISWSSDGCIIFAVDTGKIKQLDASTGSLHSEWSVCDHPTNFDGFVSINLANSGQFIVYTAGRFVTLWDTLTHAQVGAIEHASEVTSISLSPDDNCLAIGQLDNSLIFRDLREDIPKSYLLTVPSLSPGHFQWGRTDTPSAFKEDSRSQLSTTFQASLNDMPFMALSDVTFAAWIQYRLGNAESVLTLEIQRSVNSLHYAYANRGLIRARSRQWSEADEDAEESIAIQPSVIGFIAKSTAMVGMGKIEQGYQTIDLAFIHCDSSELGFLQLVKSIIIYEAGKHDQAISHVKNLVDTADDRLSYYFVLIPSGANVSLSVGIKEMQQGNYESATKLFKHDEIPMQSYTSPRLTVISLIFGWVFDDLGITLGRNLCEALYAAGHPGEAVTYLHGIVDGFNEDFRPTKSTTDWITAFSQRCIETLLGLVDMAPTAQKKDEGITHCSIALSLSLPASQRLFIVQSRERASESMWNEALNCANGAITLDPLSPWGYERRRAALHGVGHYDDAIQAHKMMLSLLAKSLDPLTRALHYQYINPSITETIIRGVVERTLRGFPRQVIHTVTGRLHDKATQASTFEGSSTFKELVSSMATHIDRAHIEHTVVKYYRYITVPHSWDDDTSLLKAVEDISIYDLEPSPVNDQLRDACSGAHDVDVNYVSFVNKEAMIRGVVEQTVRDLPRVLIDTTTGCLVDKAKQAASFGASTTYAELASSMTTHVDRVEIEQAVAKYYRYVMLSHKWGNNEPLFQTVGDRSVYQLDPTPENNKLRNFCSHARNAGFKWAWSDTCCIDKSNLVVLQESLVSMFKWYRGSALTIVYLQGVRSPSKPGDLTTSLWNTRAWTYQEYVAAEVIQFYIEDWTPFLRLPIYDDDQQIVNHKVSPAVVADMEKAIRIDSGNQNWPEVRPGLDNIREKLCLVSTRHTTLIEDAAYSLLGIFSIAMPVIYGEGENALARLLGNVLTGSGDASILAWTGEPSSYNSCLPARITVFSQLATSHLPSRLTPVEMTSALTVSVSVSRSRSREWDDPRLAKELYDRLEALPPPWFAANRLKLPCIAFKLELGLEPLAFSFVMGTTRVYRAKTVAFGNVEIWTTEDLSRSTDFYLVHPWINALLLEDPEIVVDARSLPLEVEAELSLLPSSGHHHDSETIIVHEERPRVQVRQNATAEESWQSPPAGPASPLLDVAQTRLLARLKLPFGALLLARRTNGVGFRRVAADRSITVQLRDDDVRLIDLIDNVRTLEVL